MLQVKLETYRPHKCVILSNLANPKPKNFICLKNFAIFICVQVGSDIEQKLTF